jgi:hypothetical protein
MAFTLETIQGRVERRLGDTNAIKPAQWYDMATDLNQLLYRTMFSIDPKRFIDSSTTYTVSTAPSTQALPATFRDIQEEDCGFYIRDAAGKDTTQRLTPTGFGSQQLGYYVDGTNVVFTGIGSSTTIVLRFVPVLADITAPSGVFIVPDENKDLVTEGMVLSYYKYEEDPRESIADQRFARLLGEFEFKLSKTPLTMGMADPASSF